MENPKLNNSLITAIESDADHLGEHLDITKVDAVKSRSTIINFVRSYKNKQEGQSNVVWLSNEFQKYPDIWEVPNEANDSAKEIINAIEQSESAREELNAHFDKGLSRENWLEQKIKQGATANGVNNITKYASQIDQAISNANEANIKVITTQAGNISQNPNLDGYIAEYHHANTFNLDAAAKGSEYRAEVLEPKLGEAYGKNTVDIVIKDGNGKIVRKYQSKYGADAKTTDKLLKDGDYKGQRKLVPEGQEKDVRNSTETIEVDEVTSKPLSKKEAKELQRKAQEEHEAKHYDWQEASLGTISKNISKNVILASIFSVGFQGARILGRRIWNGLSNNTNQTAEEDLHEFIQSSIQSAKSTGITVALAGGMTVIVKSGWLGKALKNTPAGRIANAVYLGVENIKILYKFGKGELTSAEALDEAGNTTCSVVGGLVAGTQGASIGASLGSVLGPAGTVLGGLTGGVIGGMAGSSIGEAIYEGGKKMVSTTVSAVKSVAAGISSMASSAVSAFGLFS